jgi:hypothetical protein
MKTIINKIVFGALFCFVSWKGLDGLFVNYYSRSLFDIDIEKLDQSDGDRHRYFKVNNGIAYGTYIYYEENLYSPVDIVYPVISAKEVEDLQNGRNVEAKLLVRRNKLNRDCLKYGSCFYGDSISVMGLSRIGLESLSDNDYMMLEDEHLKIAPNAILLEAGAGPVAIHWNLLMFIGGTVFAFTILKSFFQKAYSIQEYWMKVSEQAKI